MAIYNKITSNPFSGIDVGDFSAPVFADVDGDGLLDLVTGDRQGKLQYYKNTGSTTSPVYTAQTGSSPFNSIDVGTFSSPVFADINSDGLMDLVLGDRNGLLSYYQNTGSQNNPTYTRQTGPDNPFSLVDVGDFSTTAWADIDNDGKTDLVIGDTTGALKYYKNMSTSTVISYVEQTGASDPFSGLDFGTRVSPAFVDINGDNLLDLAIGRIEGAVDYYQNTGSATSPVYTQQTGSSNPLSNVSVTRNSTPTFVDGDGDGDLDIVVGDKDGLLSYFENTTPTVDTAITQTAGNLTIIDSAGGNSDDMLTLVEAAGKITISDLGNVITASGDAVQVDSNTVEVNASTLTGPISINVADGRNVVIATQVRQDLVMTGGSGYSILKGGSGNDVINGGSGKNKIEGGAGADVLDGQGGNDDTVEYTNSSAGVTVNLGTSSASGGDAEGDTIANFENVSGSNKDDSLTGDSGNNFIIGRNGNDFIDAGDGSDKLYGGKGNDVINGGDGNDFMRGGRGADIIDGGAGIDTIYYIDSTGGVTVDLNAGSFSRGEAEGDVVTNVENVNGSNFRDFITGTNEVNKIRGYAGNDTLSGLGGNDLLIGAAGADVLIGGDGADILLGGDGADQFKLRALSDSLVSGRDRIQDLNIGEDTIRSTSGVAKNKVDQLGSVSNLTERTLQGLLSETVFEASSAATFSLGSKTFLAINDNVSGFLASSDAVIEITGFTGDLSQLSVLVG